MNEIVYKFLLVEDKFMTEIHLSQNGFIYSAWEPFRQSKNKKKKKKIKETGDTRYIYQNQLDKVCFQHDMAYGDFKDLTRRTASDKTLLDKAVLILLKIWNTININAHLLQLVSGIGIKNVFQIKNTLKNYTNQVLENFKKQELHSS